MRYVEKVRTYAKQMPLSEAVEQAVNECIRDDILADFLKTYKGEAMDMSIYEYDEEKHMQQVFAEGEAKGEAKGITLARKVFKLKIQEKTISEIAEECKITEAEVEAILE